ncbi:MAG TPA: RNA polymerase sigma-70 factor [Phaeodactylibacter sp.]|nr:RNA polymerase sigma-70 factor [Phaeodactylibacter sp.]
MPIKSILTDEQLWKEVSTANQSAYRQLFDRYYPYLLVTVTNISGDRNLAKDIAQDVFFELWKKRETLEIHSAFKAYLRRAAVNKTINAMKSRARISSDEEVPERSQAFDTPQNTLENKDLQSIINQAIESLPVRCRMVFTLCRIEGMSHKEIADQMDISTKTVEHQMTKALKILKSALAPYISQGLLTWLCILLANL